MAEKDWRAYSINSRWCAIYKGLLARGYSVPTATMLANVCRFESGCIVRHEAGLPVVILDNFIGGDWRAMQLGPAVRGRAYFQKAVQLGVVSQSGKRLRDISRASNALFEWALENDTAGLADFSVGPAGHFLGVHRATIQKYVSLQRWYERSAASDLWNLLPLLAWEGSKWATVADNAEACRKALLAHGGNQAAVERLFAGGCCSTARRSTC